MWRVEYSFLREALHDLLLDGVFWGIEDVYELPERLPLLWAYAAGHVEGGADGLPDGWLRCVTPTKDKTRSRWPTHPIWKVVQGAFAHPMEKPENFGKIVRKRHEQYRIDKGIEAVMGYLTRCLLEWWRSGCSRC
ncbi:hypothetical protein [Dictyobacter kobayashii]|uniref:Uncharacterized protein n=1 Tax=Dictyobacter kobayashii TaxID=2014872 RepID=A0A402AHP9_9CHLR|nr:hypothetical protein [Dictyobacter kobayashii]GCE18627.1 hypothetical protein KDK_24270 [Dictyobacter kobayashii]